MKATTRTATSDWLRGNVLGLVAIFIALGGTAYATHPGGANTISSGDIINGEVKNGDIGNLEVKANNVAPDSLGGGKIADGSVKNADLGVGASSSNTIADRGIQGIDVKLNTLTGGEIDEGTLFNDNSLTGDDIDESTLSGIPSTEAWNLVGNSGTTAANFLGTTDNQPLNLRVNDARALRLEPASDGTNQSPNVIGGIADNSVTAGVHSATIGGGGRSVPACPACANRVTDNGGTVGGGSDNQAGDADASPTDADSTTVGGGSGNTASAGGATVGGGANHDATGLQATVGGGNNNDATGAVATVSGGAINSAAGQFATVPGGSNNTALGTRSLAAGRQAKANHQGAFVWADNNAFDFLSTADNQFSARATGGARLVSGIDGSGIPTSGLELPAGTSGWSTLVNGQPFDVRVNGARGLRVDPASDGTNQSPNVIGGIADNAVTAGVHSATIGGGGRNNAADPATANRVTDNGGTVGGGGDNQAGNNDGTVVTQPHATVGGGRENTASGARATVGGGFNNDATETEATVGGGDDNDATGEEATVGGGFVNKASGDQATVPGGFLNTALGVRSFAAGTRAKANHAGAFVWGDDQAGDDMASTANNQFIARASGEFFLQSDSSLDDQGGFINTSTGGFLSTGGAWTNSSDENDKAGFADVSPIGILDRVARLPVRSWHYEAEPDVRHIGPVAQDFYRAFKVGPDERHIASVDADGVALAAIKGLEAENDRLSSKLRAERQARLKQKRELEARLATLERDDR